MRQITLLIAAAPLALLAACGDNDTEEVIEPEPLETTAALDTGTPAPGPATALEEAGDISGNYSYTADDGTSTAVRLNAGDNTYYYVGSDGEVKSGTYERMSDGYRIKFNDWYGTPTWFTFSNGDLIRLQQDTDVTPDLVVEGERFARGEDDDVMFSRFPEPGSPVAPQGDN